MTDFAIELAALRAAADQELTAPESAGGGDRAEITIPARTLVRLLDLVEPQYHRGNSDHPQTPLRT